LKTAICGELETSDSVAEAPIFACPDVRFALLISKPKVLAWYFKETSVEI
jgi:hypothetical protein